MKKLMLVLMFAWAAMASANPNILFILVDDLGGADLGCYGHPLHETPHIDRLAAEGMRFTQAYASAPICSASRACIMTGKTTARVGLEFVVKEKPGSQTIVPPQPLEAPPFTLALDLKETTMAEHLAGAGYETAYFGKWHLNPHYGGRYLAWSPTHGPAQQGFSTAIEDFGSHPYNQKTLDTLQAPGSYHPDGLTQHAIGFLRQKHSKPFFMMVSHFYVHTPVRTPNEWLLKKYNGRIPQGVKKRDNRVAYAAFLETLDHHVGELLAALDETGLADNTLVVFMSDNGGHPEYASNQPLRGSKWNLYEGGIRVPMMVRWPGNVKAGAVCETPVIGYDLFPTFAEAAGAPADFQTLELDGQKLPIFGKTDNAPERSLVWHFPYYHPEEEKFGQSKKTIGVGDYAVSQTRPQSAIRRGDRKLVYFEEEGRTELYNIEQDVSEQTDLSAAEPEKAAQLKRELLRYLDKVHARRAKRIGE